MRTGRFLVLVLASAVVLGGFAAVDATILSADNLASIAVFGVEIGIVALGQTLVICGGDGAIDLSVGAISGLAEAIAGQLIAHGTPWPLALVCGIGTGAVAGLLNGVAVARVGIPPIIATLGSMFAYAGLALVLAGGSNIDLSSASPHFLALGQGLIAGVPFQLVAVYSPLLVLALLVQHRTVFGRSLYLTGTNALAATLSGIPVARVRGATYAIAGVLAGLAGMVAAARLGTATPDGIDQANLISIAIVVLGGTSIYGGDGSVGGTAIATALIAIADYGLSYNDANPIFQAGVMGVILIGVVGFENLGGRWRWRRRSRERPASAS